MPIIVEDGTGVAGANSYASEDYLETYADDRGLTLASGDAGAALIRASDWIDYTFRFSFAGVRTYGASQGRLWPRKAGSYYYGVYAQTSYLTTIIDFEGIAIPINQIPIALKNATCEAAIREMVSPGSLAPDLDRGGAIKALKAGSVAIEYFGSAPAQTTFTIIDGLLGGLLVNVETSRYTGRAVRA